MQEKKKTPAQASESDNDIITSSNVEVQTEEIEVPEFVDKTYSDMDRYKILPKIVKYYCGAKGPNPIAKAQLHEWNKRHCDPPYSDDELDAILFTLSSNEFVKQTDKGSEKKLAKGLQLYEAVMCDGETKLFFDQSNEPYARVNVGKKSINLSIRSEEFADFARRRFYQKTSQSVSEPILKETVSLLSTKALFDGDQHDLFHRVAMHDGDCYYDLLNELGEVVRIDKNGWEIISGDEVPFLFKKGCGREQVAPKRGGKLKDFLELINLNDTDQQMLFVSTLPVRLIQDIDQALAYIHGPAGSAKTTLLKMTKELIDPSVAGVSLPISSIADFEVLLNQTWLFANDNISEISKKLSNFFCVMATGAEGSRRKLYSDASLVVFRIKNPAYLTGINIAAIESDLSSRLLLFKTDMLSRENRVSGNDIQVKFEQLKPYLLGAMFDTLSEAMRIKSALSQDVTSRMADFVLWGAACAEVLGYGEGNFKKAYEKSEEERAYNSVCSKTSGRSLIEYITENSEFIGTMSELLTKLKNHRSDSDLMYHEPVAANPAALGRALRDSEDSYSELGIRIDFDHHRSSTERQIRVWKEIDRNVSEKVGEDVSEHLGKTEVYDDSNDRPF